MQALGDRANYVEIDGSGPNALDFHIAYYIGELATADPTGSFTSSAKTKDSIRFSSAVCAHFGAQTRITYRHSRASTGSKIRRITCSWVT